MIAVNGCGTGAALQLAIAIALLPGIGDYNCIEMIRGKGHRVDAPIKSGAFYSPVASPSSALFAASASVAACSAAS